MHSALFLPLFEALADPAVVARLSAEAEVAGWDGVFVWDHLRYSTGSAAAGSRWEWASGATRSRASGR